MTIARVAFTRMYASQTRKNAIDFPRKAFAAAVHAFGLKANYTRPYRPQTNGKAARIIQSALRE